LYICYSQGNLKSMNPTEKIVLQKVLKNLESSTRVDWLTGDLPKWSAWANQMRRSISDAISILNGLAEIESEENEKSKKDLLGG